MATIASSSSSTTAVAGVPPAPAPPSSPSGKSSSKKKRRSIQWRLHLGLLPSPNSIPTNDDPLYVAARIIEQQRQQYHELVLKHPYPKNECEGEGEDDNDTSKNGDNNNAKGDDPKTKTTTAEGETKTLAKDGTTETPEEKNANKNNYFVDPLSAIVYEEQQEKKRMEEMDLEYRKERAKIKRGTADKRIIPESEEYDARYVILQMLDKDLNRLPYPPPLLENEDNEDEATNERGGYDSVQQHKQLQQRWEWRKTVLKNVLYVWACEYPKSGYLQGMHEIASYVLYAIELETYNTAIETVVKKSSTTATPKNSDPNTSTHITSNDEEDGMEDVKLNSSNSNEDAKKETTIFTKNLFVTTSDDPTYQRMCADTYTLMDCILRTGLQAAYDLNLDQSSPSSVTTSTTPQSQSSGSVTTVSFRTSDGAIKPLIGMSQRVLSRIVFQDPQLGQLLTSNSIPIPLLLTKWVRVLFTREIDTMSTQLALADGISATTRKDERQVLDVWDILFRMLYEQNLQLYDKMSLQTAVECMATARFILHTHTIRQYLLNNAGGGNECLHWLMNIPLENTNNIRVWMAIMKSIVSNQRISNQLFHKLPKSAAILPEPQPQPQPFLVNMTAASAAAAAGFYPPNDPSKNIRSASYSGNNQDQYQQQQQQSLATMSSFGSNNNLKFSLLNIKDKIADKTQSLQKRIQQEWEAFQQQQEQMMIQQQQQQEEYRHQQEQQRTISNNTSQYNLNYHRTDGTTGWNTQDYQTQYRQQYPQVQGQELRAVQNTSANGISTTAQLPSAVTISPSKGTPALPAHPLQAIGSPPLTSSSSSTTNYGTVSQTQGWANRIEQNIAAIQSYIIQMEQRRPALPSENMEPRNKVWESLAELQVICNELKSVNNPI